MLSGLSFSDKNVCLFTGSAAGGALGAYRSQGKFKSAVYIIKYEMTERDRQRLADAVAEVVRNVDATDLITVMTLLNGNAIMKNAVLEIMKKTLSNNMGVTFVQ